MNYKYPFFILAVGMLVAGIIPIGISQSQTEPSMEIDMLNGQTQNPFRIQNSQNEDVFRVNVDGSLFPAIIESFTITLDSDFADGIVPLLASESPSTVINESSESGAGVYQWEYTIQDGDLHTEDMTTVFELYEHSVAVSTILENTGAGAISINGNCFKDDVEFATWVDASVASGSYLRTYDFRHSDFMIDGGLGVLIEGSTIGCKFWTDTAGDLQLSHIAIWDVPSLKVKGLGIGANHSYDEIEICPNSPIVGLVSSCSTLVDHNYCTAFGCGEVFPFNHPHVPHGGVLRPEGNVVSGYELETVGTPTSIFAPQPNMWSDVDWFTYALFN